MKKNAMLKIAAILVVAVLLTTCAISATFAKYTTTSSMSNASARVAKWGVSVAVTANAPFAKAYTHDGKVVVNATDNAVAPGTENASAVSFTISGTPEVMTTTTSNFALTLSNWSVGSPAAEYCPIYFTVTVDGDTENAKTIGIGDGYDIEASNIADLQDEVAEALNQAAGTNVAAKTNLSKSVVLGWAWDYKEDADSNLKDTALGNAAAQGNAATIQISGGITITQVGANHAVAS